MNENRFSLEITGAQKTEINTKINELIALLEPMVIALDKEDRKRLSKMSDESIPFVEKVEQYSGTNPEFLPPYVDAAEFKKDFAVFKDIREILRPLMQIVGNLEDTRMLSGAEAYEVARGYYKMVGLAAKMNTPNAQAIYDDLRARFEIKAKPAGESNGEGETGAENPT